MDKPVALLNASTSGGEYANLALIEILRTMSGRVVLDACLLAAFVRKKVDAAAAAADPTIAEAVRGALAALARSVKEGGPSPPG